MSRHRLSPTALGVIAARFRALGEPARLAILDALRDGERSVTDLVEATGQAQANVSRHLGVLHAAGLVSRRREGLYVHYAVAGDDVYRLCDLACSRLQRDAEAMARAVG